jgi:hypothetical protein
VNCVECLQRRILGITIARTNGGPQFVLVCTNKHWTAIFYWDINGVKPQESIKPVLNMLKPIPVVAARSKALDCGGLRVRIPPRGMDVCLFWAFCVVKGLCVGLITRPEESYRVWCVCEWLWSLGNKTLGHKGLSNYEKLLKIGVLIRQFYQCWTSGSWQYTSSFIKRSVCGKPTNGGSSRNSNHRSKTKRKNSQLQLLKSRI